MGKLTLKDGEHEGAFIAHAQDIVKAFGATYPLHTVRIVLKAGTHPGDPSVTNAYIESGGVYHEVDFEIVD